MRHNLLTSASARILALAGGGAAASEDTTTPTPTPTPAPAPTPTPTPTPASSEEGEQAVDVVSLADAQAAATTARAEGIAAENKRTTDVLASDAGKANPTMAAWMLSSNPGATAESIIAQLATCPAAAAPAKALSASEAITVPLTETPKVTVAPAATSGDDGKTSAEDIDKLWASSRTSVAAQINGSGPVPSADGIIPTGN